MCQSRKALYVFMGILIVLSLALSGCAREQAPAETRYALYAYNSEPLTNWDPAIEFSNGIHVMNNIYEQLLRYDPERDEIIPLLATEYDVSEDGLTWTFKLRQGVKFHDGSDFNAEAVKFSIERTMRLGSGAAYIWDAVEKINVIDDYTVEFQLTYPSPLDLVAATGYAAFIYSPKELRDNDDWFQAGNASGTGPYKLKSYVWGDEVVLEKFDDYWGGWADNQITTVVIKKIGEPATRRQLIETGEASVTHELPFSDVNALMDNPDVVVGVYPSFQNLLATFNTEKEPLDNVLVRQALSYAFPYDDVIDFTIGGYASQSKGAVPVGMWGHGEDLYQYSYNLDKAKELLTEAGYPEGGFSLLATYLSGDEAEKGAMELYKAELAKLNIDLEIRGMPWDSQWDLARNPDPRQRQDIFVFYWWPDLPSPYSFLYSPFHSEDEIFFNLAYYKNPEFDEMIDAANELTALDREKAEAMFIDAQNILIADAPSLFIYDKEYIWVTTKNFTGFKPNPAYPTVIFFYEATLE